MDAEVGLTSDIRFINVTSDHSEGTVLLSANGSTHPLTNVLLENVRLRFTPPSAPPRPGLVYTPPEHDYRPGPHGSSHTSAAGFNQMPCTARGKKHAVCDGISLEHVDGVTVRGGEVRFGGEEQSWWGPECVGSDVSSRGVVVEGTFECVRAE